MAKTNLLIEIDCDGEHCGECSRCFYKGETNNDGLTIYQYNCELFGATILTNAWGKVPRCTPCLAARAPITLKPGNFRNVVWCPYLNEPEILEYRGFGDDRHPYCRGCGDGKGKSSYEPETHPTLFRVLKPMD